MDIITLLTGLSQCLDETSIKQLTVIVKAMVTMSGRVTMSGLSRWSEKGGSYRTTNGFTTKQFRGVWCSGWSSARICTDLATNT